MGKVVCVGLEKPGGGGGIWVSHQGPNRALHDVSSNWDHGVDALREK